MQSKVEIEGRNGDAAGLRIPILPILAVSRFQPPALQQITPYIRTGKPLPAAFVVPIVRDNRRTATPAAPADVQKPDSDTRGRVAAFKAGLHAICTCCKRQIEHGDRIEPTGKPVNGRQRWAHVGCTA